MAVITFMFYRHFYVMIIRRYVYFYYFKTSFMKNMNIFSRGENMKSFLTLSKSQVFIILCLIILTFALILYIYGQSVSEREIIYFRMPNVIAVTTYGNDELESPFPLPSSIYQIKGDIRIGLEKIVREKFFIIYSTVTGDQSYFGVHLLIEDMQKRRLSKGDYEGIWLIDDLGNRYDPMPYFKIEDFPENQPLGWKLTFFGKFEPVNPKAKFINIYFRYNGKVYELAGIDLP